jgi:hypothetical protein
MMLRGWLGAIPLCTLLAVGAGCGDEEGDTNDDSADGDGGHETDAGADEDDAATPSDSDAGADGLDSGAPEAGQGGQDAGSDARASSDASTVELDQDGFPILPSGKTNVIFLSISNSSSETLADGLYQAPFSPNGSSGTTLSYLDSSYIFTMMPSLQVQMRLTRAMTDGSFECESGSADLLVRYGKPPSGNNQLLTNSCTVTYHHDVGKNEYTGTIEAVLGDGLTSASEEATAEASARFAVIGSNK